MDNLSAITKESTKEEIITILELMFIPYAKELINSGGDFSYMNMYADNFMNQITFQSSMSDHEVFELLNEVCVSSWQKASGV